MVSLYDAVRIITDRFIDEGVPRGSIGYVIEEFAGDAFEVELSNAEGITVATIVAKSRDIEVVRQDVVD